MSVRDSSAASLAARRTSVKSRHFRIGAGFVDEVEALRVKIDLLFEPLLTRGIYIAAPLLGGVRCLFLSVIFLRWKKRQSEAMPADIPRRFNNLLLQLGERDIRLHRHRVQNQLLMCFDPLRSAVTARSFRSDVASFLETTAPADRAGRTDTKTLGGPPTGQAIVNRGDHPLAKINGKRPGHAC